MDGQTTLCLVVLIVIFLVCAWSSREYFRENYGGPIKRLRRIPKNDCYRICGQHYTACMAPYYQGRLVDAEMCQRRRDNCISVCNYSDFQRL
jgi:hypothetical protein